MQVDPRDLQIVLGLALRAPKYPGEARLLELLTAQWNEQQKRGENGDNRNSDTGGTGATTEPGK